MIYKGGLFRGSSVVLFYIVCRVCEVGGGGVLCLFFSFKFYFLCFIVVVFYCFFNCDVFVCIGFGKMVLILYSFGYMFCFF